MSRTLTAVTVREIFRQETGEAWLVLLTFDHALMAAPIRVSSDGVDTLSRGNTFSAFPFQLDLPHEAANEMPRARIRIDNVDGRIVEALRSLAGSSEGPSVLMEIVRAADPDTVEGEWPNFRLDRADWDDLVVSGELGLDFLEGEPCPAPSFDNDTAPGVFG